MANKDELLAAIAKARLDRETAVNEVLMAYANGTPIANVKAYIQDIANADETAAKDLTELLKVL